MTGRVHEALELSGEARRLADELGAFDLRVSAGYPYWLHLAGHPREALEELDQVIELTGTRREIGRDTVDLSVPIWCEFYRAPVLIELGRLDEAGEALERALALARKQDESRPSAGSRRRSGTWRTSAGPETRYRSGMPVTASRLPSGSEAPSRGFSRTPG
jgi:hypothetical protein